MASSAVYDISSDGSTQVDYQARRLAHMKCPDNRKPAIHTKAIKVTISIGYTGYITSRRGPHNSDSQCSLDAFQQRFSLLVVPNTHHAAPLDQASIGNS
ncbi:hypothetical protein STUTZSP0542_41640 [Stutzerimonas marianensis]